MTTQAHSGSPCSPAFGRRGLFVGSGHRSDLVDDAPGSSTEGQVVERYLYDPYGRVTVLDNDWNEIAWSASRKNEILFTGYRYNPETGYYQVRHREFNPLMGRWVQRDPLGYVDGGNLYEYVKGNPATFIDSTGESAQVAGVIIAGAALGYNVVHNAVQSSSDGVNWTFDSLKGTVFVSDRKVELNRGWRRAECEVSFHSPARAFTGAEFSWEVTYWYHERGHISQITVSKMHAASSFCRGLNVNIDIIAVPGDSRWDRGTLHNLARKTPRHVQGIENRRDGHRRAELKVTYSVKTPPWNSNVTANTRWIVTGDGSMYRRSFERRGHSTAVIREGIVRCNFDAR